MSGSSSQVTPRQGADSRRNVDRAAAPTPPAATVVPPGGGPFHWVMTDRLQIKLGPDQTANALGFVETIAPPGGGPPPHLHRDADELFYILDGELTLLLGDQLIRATPGTAAYLPRGSVHTYKNDAASPARFLVAVTPASFADFVREVATPWADAHTPPPVGQADLDRLLAGCAKFGLEMRFDHPPARGFAPPRPADRAYWVWGEHVRIKLGAADTGGQFCVAEVSSRPGGGVPPHLHRAMDELFYVLEGTYEFTVGDPSRGDASGVQTVAAPPGTFVHVPAGVFHGFRNVGPGPARVLDLHSPGAFEAFFVEAGEPCAVVPAFEAAPPPPPGPEDMGRLLAFLDKHGMDVPGR